MQGVGQQVGVGLLYVLALVSRVLTGDVGVRETVDYDVLAD